MNSRGPTVTNREKLAAFFYQVKGYRRRHGRFPTLRKPALFTEKLCARLLETRSSEVSAYLGPFVDKLQVRSHVEHTLGSQFLPQLYFSYASAEELSASDFSHPLVLKTNHGSGTLSFFEIHDIPISERKLDETTSLVAKELERDYSKHGFEFQYRHVRPQVFGEELLSTEVYDRLYTAYVYCFDGKAALIQMYDLDHTVNSFFDTSWNQLHLAYRPHCSQPALKRPSELSDLIQAAEVLAAPFDFVRIDFNLTSKGLKFSEITFTPTAASMVIKPTEWDQRLGLIWNYRRILG